MTRAPLRGIHVLWVILGFFAVTFAVNAVFIVRAVSTFPGELAPKSWLQGLDYNSTLARREGQKRLGWTAAIGFDDAATPALRLSLQSAAGVPVRDSLDVALRYRAVGDATHDGAGVMTHLGGGEYAAVIGRLPPGRVEVEIEARRHGEEAIVFEAHKVLFAP